MDPGYGDLDSLFRRGVSNDHLPTVLATHRPWPLADYNTEASDHHLFPHFVSTPTLPPLFQCSSPCLLLPNMQINPLADFHGDCKPSYQEPCSSSIFPSVDSHAQVSPCLVYTGFPESRPDSYSKSTPSREDTIPLGRQRIQNLKIDAAAMPSLLPIFSSNLAYQREIGEPESLSTTAVTSTGKEPPSELESIAVRSKIGQDTVPARASITKSGDSYSCSGYQTRPESLVTTAGARCKSQAPKRRKSQQKRVVCVPATGGTDKPTGECIPSDSWAWRKYGQKPIKGSPYPRGYYRCSSCKGCTARKQVERSRSDPSMLVITYSSDHNHAGPTPRNATNNHISDAKTNPNSDHHPANSDGTCEPSDNSLSSIVNSPATHHEDPVGSPSTVTTKDSRSTLDHHVTEFDVGSNSNITWDDDFFTQLDRLSDCFFMPGSLADERSDEEGSNHTVDPYNLFNWSSSVL